MGGVRRKIARERVLCGNVGGLEGRGWVVSNSIDHVESHREK
jgi:hypothetical protein